MASIYQSLNSGYQTLLSSNKVYVKIDKIDYGSFPVDRKSTIIGCVGSRYSFKQSSYAFPITEMSPNKVWDFDYKNSAKASFVVVLFKHRFFGSDEEIGEVELKLSGFEINTVTTHEFTLKCPYCGNPAKVTLSVHICEDGSPRFTAPLNNKVQNGIVIPHQKCYCQN